MKKIIFLLLLAFQSFLAFSQDPIVYFTTQSNLGYGIIEGNTYTFAVNLYSASTTDVIVDVSTVHNTTDGSDYTAFSNIVTIPAGQLSSTPFSIATTNDNTIEGNENFIIEGNVTSGNTSNTSLQQNVTIYDNDETPTVIFSTSPSIVESYGYSYYANLSNYFNEDVTIQFATSAGTADASDYIPTATTITIPAGERLATFPITTQDDTIIEADETYTITATVTSGNATNNSTTITVTIVDNDVTPTLMSINNRNFYENYNNGNVSVYINRIYNSNVNIQLTSSNGTADNSDYNPINQIKTITPGQTHVNFYINVIDDTIDEPLEFFNITATVTSGNTTNVSESAIVNIIDNDGLPDFYIESFIENPNNPTGEANGFTAEEGFEIKFRPALRHASPVDTEITFTATNGTAGNADYTTSTLTTTIPAGQNINYNEVLSYPTILDQFDEDDETFFINATVTSGNTFNTTESVEAIILDNYAINAQPDVVTSIVEVGTSYQVLDNDTFEGLAVDASDITVSLVGTNTIGATIDASGMLTIPANVPMGYYQLTYEICESANPTSCDTAAITVFVESPLDVTVAINHVDFNADTFISAGDTIEFLYTVTNNGNAPITDIDVSDNNYSTLEVLGGPLASLGAGQSDSTTFYATHVLTQQDINYGYFGGDQEGVTFIGTYYGYEVNEWVYEDYYLGSSDGIKLNAFVDTNGNGTQEYSEANFPLGQFDYEVNNDGIIYNLLVSPHFLYEPNPTSTYDLNYTVDPDYAAYNTTSASYNDITVPTGSGITTYNFPITTTPYEDLSVEVVSAFNAAVPGFDYFNYIIFTNNSSETITTGNIEFFMDSALNLVDVTELAGNWWQYNPSDAVTTATGFSYDFNDLLPYETRRLRVKMTVPTLPTVSLGQLVTNSATIELLPGEISPLNNDSSITQTIVGSYDPNDITERHGPEIVHSTFTSDDYLTYTIRFENTGTANAINIRVEDILDDQLDESTLKMVDASHEYTLERVGKNLEWNFFAIQLPPSTDDENSQFGHGYITFKIKPMPDYQIGDVIPNTAEIYFDFNPAIITNTWTTTFVESLSTDEVAFSNLKVYPNPVSDQLLIQNNTTITEVEMTSLLGKQILKTTVDNNTATLELSEFTKGVYFLKIKTEASEETIKILKE